MVDGPPIDPPSQLSPLPVSTPSSKPKRNRKPTSKGVEVLVPIIIGILIAIAAMYQTLWVAQALLSIAGATGVGLIIFESKNRKWSTLRTIMFCVVVFAGTILGILFLPSMPPQNNALTATEKDIKDLQVKVKEAAEQAGEKGAQKVLDEFMKAQPKRSSRSEPSLKVAPAPPPPPPSPLPVLSEIQKSLESKIDLVEFYPKYEWPATDIITVDPIPVRNFVLQAKFEENRDYRLTPLISNDNDGVPLYEPRVTIILPLDIKVKPTKLWAPNVSSAAQSFHGEGFGPVVKGQYRGLNESLFVQFPRPGRYTIFYSIIGIARGISVNVQGQFVLEVS